LFKGIAGVDQSKVHLRRSIIKIKIFFRNFHSKNAPGVPVLRAFYFLSIFIYSLMNRSVVVIEKDEHILELVSIVLTAQGFKVTGLRSEIGAIQVILDVQPCAIILDIIKVTEDGTELCRRVRTTAEIKDIPIIVLSTHPKAETVKNVCADEVLFKPFNIDELIAAVEKQVII
jgi:PleD family two-component response regulator